MNKLTPREQQVINMLLQGYENEEMANELGIAHRTVKALFARLYLRYGIHDGVKRVKLAVLMYRKEMADAKENR